jgi:transposase
MKISVVLTAKQREMVEQFAKKTQSVVEAQRARIVVLLSDGYPVAKVATVLGCVRSTVYTSLYRFEDEGLEGFKDKRLGGVPRKVTVDVRAKLVDYLDVTPRDFGWQRSSWTLELLALQLEQDTQVKISKSYVRVLLKQEKCRRGRPCPVLRVPVRGRRQILDRIETLVNEADAANEVFYVDEADIDLNPRIGTTYMKRGQQIQVPTPGQNIKYYIAGALNVRTGTIIYTHGLKKNSSLFTSLLNKLRATYRRATKLHLICDNYIIHKSQETRQAIELAKERLELHFLPPYSPQHNKIERLWKQMHDHVTRNHRHQNMAQLWEEVVRFLKVVQPFPGTKISTLRLSA